MSAGDPWPALGPVLIPGYFTTAQKCPENQYAPLAENSH